MLIVVVDGKLWAPQSVVSKRVDSNPPTCIPIYQKSPHLLGLSYKSMFKSPKTWRIRSLTFAFYQSFELCKKKYILPRLFQGICSLRWQSCTREKFKSLYQFSFSCQKMDGWVPVVMKHKSLPQHFYKKKYSLKSLLVSCLILFQFLRPP